MDHYGIHKEEATPMTTYSNYQEITMEGAVLAMALITEIAGIATRPCNSTILRRQLLVLTRWLSDKVLP